MAQHVSIACTSRVVFADLVLLKSVISTSGKKYTILQGWTLQNGLYRLFPLGPWIYDVITRKNVLCGIYCPGKKYISSGSFHRTTHFNLHYREIVFMGNIIMRFYCSDSPYFSYVILSTWDRAMWWISTFVNQWSNESILLAKCSKNKFRSVILADPLLLLFCYSTSTCA